MGLEDALKHRAYTHSMKCVSATGSVYRIKLEDFNLKMQRDEKTWQLITDIANQKDSSTISKIKQAQKNKKIGVSVNPKRVRYMNVIANNKLKKTEERVTDFRQTMNEIIGLKNGKIPLDYVDEYVPVHLMNA